MQQRGIRLEDLEMLLDFGYEQPVRSRGNGIVYFNKKSRARLARLNPNVRQDAERLCRTYAVVGANGIVITVGHRYRRIPRG
jgi:hypothetical protein